MEDCELFAIPASEMPQLANLDVSEGPAAVVLSASLGESVSQIMEATKNSIALTKMFGDDKWAIVHPTIFCGINHLTMMHRLKKKGDYEAELLLSNGNRDVDRGVIQFNWPAFEAAVRLNTDGNFVSACCYVGDTGYYEGKIHPCKIRIKDSTSGAVLRMLILKPWWHTEANPHFMIAIFDQNGQNCTSRYLNVRKLFHIQDRNRVFEELHGNVIVKKVTTGPVKYGIREGFTLVEITPHDQRQRVATHAMISSQTEVKIAGVTELSLKSVNLEKGLAGHVITSGLNLYCIRGEFPELDDALKKNGNLSHIVRLPDREWGIISSRVKVEDFHCVKAFKLKETDDPKTAQLLPWDTETSNITSPETIQFNWPNLRLRTEAFVPASEIVDLRSVFDGILDPCEIRVKRTNSDAVLTINLQKALWHTEVNRRFMIKILDQDGQDCTSENLNGREWLHIQGGDRVFGEHYGNVIVEKVTTEKGHRMHNGYVEVEMRFRNPRPPPEARVVLVAPGTTYHNTHFQYIQIHFICYLVLYRILRVYSN